MIRLFAALSLPPEVTERLLALQTGLSGWRLSPERNLHVTLAFFGEIDQRQAEDVDASLSAISAPGFDLWLDGVDVFGAKALACDVECTTEGDTCDVVVTVVATDVTRCGAEE